MNSFESIQLGEESGTPKSSKHQAENVFLGPKGPIVFATQMLLLLGVIVAALINLSINNLDEADKRIWIILLSSCIGYVLPNPSMKFSTTLQQQLN